MSDECLMKQEFGIPFYVVYQAVMRKFTLASQPNDKMNIGSLAYEHRFGGCD